MPGVQHEDLEPMLRKFKASYAVHDIEDAYEGTHSPAISETHVYIELGRCVGGIAGVWLGLRLQRL